MCPERTDLSPDALVLVAPHTPIHTRLERGGVIHLYVHFVVAPPFHNPVPKVWQIPIAPPDTERLRCLWEKLMSGQGGRTAAVEPLEWIGRSLAAIPEADWEGKMMDARVHAALRRIEEELATPLSVPGLARGCNLSSSAFARLFRTHVGESPHQHLMRRRVEQAARLLARSTLTVEAVAEQCGFSDRFHFTHVFRKLRGMAPAEFRRQQAKWRQPPADQ
jgi:AraC-like DNA-binding protein